jgi:hypothetical protein
MPIRKYTAGASFGPDAIARMDTAFQKACTILNIRGSDPLVETVAKKVVSLASQGVTDADEIWRKVIADTDLGSRCDS